MLALLVLGCGGFCAGFLIMSPSWAAPVKGNPSEGLYYNPYNESLIKGFIITLTKTPLLTGLL